ncbi:MAG TPA: PEP-CTERM sorting domain-containing protein [Chthoniobacterales bacterium]
MLRIVFLACLFINFVLPSARAALLASDNAADPAYNNGWADGSNGGSGFAPWAITTNNDNVDHFAGTFIGDAGGSGINPAINTGGRAFGMYSNTSGNTSGASVSAQRDFTGGSLQVGQSFSLDIGINYRDGAKGLILNGPSPFGNQLGGFFTGGFQEHSDLTLYDLATLQSVNYTFDIYDPNALYHLTFTMIDATHLQANLTLTTASGTQNLVTLTANSAPVATGFNLYYGSTAQYYPQDDLFFNNFAVTNGAVPEPSTLGLLATGAVLALNRFGRRR